MKSYGQFCPVAMAAAMLSERWTLLVVREMLMGSCHFNQLRRGMPLMSPTLLSKRLQTLQEQGIVVRRDGADGQGGEYGLTEAGRELFPLIETLGHWGKRWVSTRLERESIDVRLLMWAMHRDFDLARVPAQRLVMQIDLIDGGHNQLHWWVILDKAEECSDLCLRDPGYEVDLLLATDVVTLTQIYIGDVLFDDARVAGRIKLQGPPTLIRSIPKWFARSLFAGTARMERKPAAAQPSG